MKLSALRVVVAISLLFLATGVYRNHRTNTQLIAPVPVVKENKKSEPIQNPFVVTDAIALAPVQSTLEALVAKNALVETNHLCVIGQPLGTSGTQAWVSWTEDRSIILWEFGLADLTLSRNYLKFGRDIVNENTEGFTASTYLVGTEWGNAVIAECASKGTPFVIKKSEAETAVKNRATVHTIPEIHT